MQVLFESTLSFTLIRQLEELRLCADSLNLSGKFNLVGLEGGNADKLKIYTKSSALKSKKLVSLGYPSNNVYEHLPVDTVYDFGGNYTLKVTFVSFIENRPYKRI